MMLQDSVNCNLEVSHDGSGRQSPLKLTVDTLVVATSHGYNLVFNDTTAVNKTDISCISDADQTMPTRK